MNNAEALRVAADGKFSDLQFCDEGGQWQMLSGAHDSQLAKFARCGWADCWEFRLKPRTVKIGSREVEAPVLEPGELKMVWCWDSDYNRPEEQYADGSVAEPQFELGLCFATEEACRAAHDAFHALLRGDA